MKETQETLRKEILESLTSQGFLVGVSLSSKNLTKDAQRKLHRSKRVEQLALHTRFLQKNYDKMSSLILDGRDLDPTKIEPELIEVKPESYEADVFLWWNLVWWSLPYDKPVGRHLKFLLWDRYHNVPFGLVGLQSPPLSCSVRDNYLGLTRRNREYWINQSMYAQRVGSLPPFNELIGGKMAALALASNEVRAAYASKYANRITLIEKKNIPNRLLFVSTTSAFGRSSVYERLTYKQDRVSFFLGLTSGAGTFHLPQRLYVRLLDFLSDEGFDTKLGYGTGPSRKLHLVEKGFRRLGLGGLSSNYAFHNVRRGFYLFPHATNLAETIFDGMDPLWHDRPFLDLAQFWRKRWAIPRSIRMKGWRDFKKSRFLEHFRRTGGLEKGILPTLMVEEKASPKPSASGSNASPG